MNYYQYKRREPRSGATDFIKPFLVIIVFAAIIVVAWKMLGPALKGGEEAMASEKVYLDIVAGGAKAMTSGAGEWKNVPTNIYLYEDEKVKTQSDGRLVLAFFDGDIVRLDKSSQIELDSVRRDAAGSRAALNLEEGKVWISIDSLAGSGSEFTLSTGLLNLKSDGGEFAVAYPGMLYVLEGSVRADIVYQGAVVKTSTLGVGQEMVVDEQIAANLKEGLPGEVIFALDDAFKSSNWYRWNQQQDDGQTGEMTDELTDETETDEADTTETEDETTDETTDSTTTETDETDDEAVTGAPAIPQIKEPGSNGDTVTIEKTEQIISGTVSKGTEGVIVNDYRLSLFKAGDTSFSYNAKVAYKNLKVGENEYEIIAVGKDGEKSKAATITLILPQSVVDEAEEEDTTEEEETTATPASSSTGGVTITSPNGGQNLVTSETVFEIKGEVPASAAKVVVNDYTLQGFKAGDTTFLYRASSTLGTLSIGKLNTYTAKAYDEEGKLLGTASMTIDVEASETGGGDPVITMPSASSSYSTTLDQVVLGGTIGKWVDQLYINGEKLTDYVPGSESWRKTITLTPGENVFSVYGEKAGDKTGTVTITITYQN